MNEGLQFRANLFTFLAQEPPQVSFSIKVSYDLSFKRCL
jgi:hypothetical protein